MSRIVKEGIVLRDPEVVSGELVSARTRVRTENLMGYPKAGHTPDGFPGVSREQAVGVSGGEGEALLNRREREAGASPHS